MPKIEALDKARLDALLGEDLLPIWSRLRHEITSLYNLNEQWHSANKGQNYELKYQKSGKTIVSLFPCFPDVNKIGVMIIFGEKERNSFDSMRASFCEESCRSYDGSKTYHDGRWVIFKAPYQGFFEDFPRLLAIKRKPDNIIGG